MVTQRVRVELSDPAMGSGVATHFFDGLTATGHQALVDFWTSAVNLMAGQVTVHVPRDYDNIDETTGDLISSLTVGTEFTGIGGGSGAYAGGVGAAVTWDTSGVVAGRRVRGRTFVVPLASGSYDTDGSLSTVVAGALSTAAQALITDAAGELVIWSRPRTGLAGSIHPVVARRVADRVAWLQSRKR